MAGDAGVWQSDAMKKEPRETSSPDPAEHCENLKRELGELKEHLRRDIDRVDDPQFKSLCETAAEVLGGLRKAFEHYGKHSEPAWRVG
jgi:hypothetical protein